MEMNYPNGIDPILIAALSAKGGGVSEEQIQDAVNSYLNENPIAPGELKVTNHIVSIAQEGE